MKVLVTGAPASSARTTCARCWPVRTAREPAAAVTVLDKLTLRAATRQPRTRARGHRAAVRRRATSATARLLRPAAARPRRVVNFAAESHVDRSIAGPAAFVRTNVLGTQMLLEACLRPGSHGSCTCPPTRCTARSRGLVDRGRAAAAQLAVLGVEGRRRPGRARVRAHLRAAGARHALLEQLRARTSTRRSSSRCSSPTCWTGAGAAVRRRPATCATGCTSTTTAAASTSWSTHGRPGRGLQHRRRHRAHQP